MLPHISLITPSYNQAAFLERALESVLAQHYPYLEYIVMDGGSTDGSVEILQRNEKHFAYWTSERDAGQSDALNRGFARATGDIFGWLNSDDVLLPNTLQTVGSYFEAHPECDFLTGDGVFINADDTRELFYVRARAYTFEDLLQYYKDNYLPQPSVFFSRRAFESVGGLDQSLHYVMDLDLWLRMRQKFTLHHLAQCLSKMRLHDDAKGQRVGQPALRVVAQVIPRYWDSMGYWKRVQIWWGLREMRARAACEWGLARVLRNDSRAGWSALREAVTLDPFFFAMPIAHKLLARLILPLALRRRWLHVP